MLMPISKIDHKLTFGKYKGETLQEVADKDVQYLAWCMKNIDGFTLMGEARDYCIKAAENVSVPDEYDDDYDELDWDPLWLEAGFFH
jgi:hypothetical protein